MLTLEKIRKDHDGIRIVFTGHTHRQLYVENHIASILNPGAVENSLWGYEFAVFNTKTGEAVFSRIMPNHPVCSPVKIGVISDSRNISDLNSYFWVKLQTELNKQGVKHIIHCGNLAKSDIGREELKEFEIYFNLETAINSTPANWHKIDPENPIVKIGGYRFCVQHNLGEGLMEKTERDILQLSLQLAGKYPETEFVLFGFTHQAYLEENEQVIVLNPGDVVRDQSFVIIEVPRNEITFSKIPRSPLSS